MQWVAQCRKLTAETEWLRQQCDRVTEENKVLVKENRRLQKLTGTQEEVRPRLARSCSGGLALTLTVCPSRVCLIIVLMD